MYSRGNKMKKEIICTECNHIAETKYYCDTCGRDLIIGVPVTLSCGYGSPLDGEEYHFCNEKCAIKFLITEEVKNNPRTSIEFGRVKPERMDYIEKGAKLGKSKTTKEKK
jgi:YHS domain-containing protein